MTTKKATPLPLRNDTILGVCEGLGMDLGVNSNLIRIAFCGIFFFKPMFAFALYLGLGLALAAIHRFVPLPKAQPAAKVEAPVANAEEELPLAA